METRQPASRMSSGNHVHGTILKPLCRTTELRAHPRIVACWPSVLDGHRRGYRIRIDNSDIASYRRGARSVLEADRHPGRKARPTDRYLGDRALRHAVRRNRRDTQAPLDNARPECLNRPVGDTATRSSRGADRRGLVDTSCGSTRMLAHNHTTLGLPAFRRTLRGDST